MALLAFFVVVVIVVGSLAIWFNPQDSKFSPLLLSFSGAYLFGYIFMHILPETYSANPTQVGSFILIGFLLQLALDFISKGIEHGHAHMHANHFPMAMFIGLCVHSIIEGMPLLSHAHEHDHQLGANALGLGILIHKIPITIVLAGLLKAYYSRKTALLYITIFAFTVPLGSIINEQLASSLSHVGNYHQLILALLVGVLLHVSTTILYETDKGHKFNVNKVGSILIGFIIAYFSSHGH
jgi:hypothetical protein